MGGKEYNRELFSLAGGRIAVSSTLGVSVCEIRDWITYSKVPDIALHEAYRMAQIESVQPSRLIRQYKDAPTKKITDVLIYMTGGQKTTAETLKTTISVVSKLGGRKVPIRTLRILEQAIRSRYRKVLRRPVQTGPTYIPPPKSFAKHNMEGRTPSDPGYLQNGIRRPGGWTLAGVVWECLDDLTVKLQGKRPPRHLLRSVLVQGGVDIPDTKRELWYGHWVVFNGLKNIRPARVLRVVPEG